MWLFLSFHVCRAKCTWGWFSSWSNRLMPRHWKEKNEGVQWLSVHTPNTAFWQLTIIFPIFSPPPSPCSFCSSYYAYVALFDSVPQVSTVLLIPIHFFSFCASIKLSSSVPLLSSACSSLLLSPSSEFLKFWFLLNFNLRIFVQSFHLIIDLLYLVRHIPILSSITLFF